MLIAIGLDRVHQDPQEPFTDRTRISINFDEAGQYGIGFKNESDILLWWANEAYFTEETLAGTRKVAEAHDHLTSTEPFSILYPSPDPPWYAAIVSLILLLAKTPLVGDVVETLGGAALASGAGAGVLLPFPLNLVAGGFSLAGIEMELSGILHLIGD